MDFRSFPPDEHESDSVFVVVDRFIKKVCSIPCMKSVTSQEVARWLQSSAELRFILDHTYQKMKVLI